MNRGPELFGSSWCLLVRRPTTQWIEVKRAKQLRETVWISSTGFWDINIKNVKEERKISIKNKFENYSFNMITTSPSSEWDFGVNYVQIISYKYMGTFDYIFQAVL